MHQPNDLFYQASDSPIKDIETVTYKGQDPNRRMYHFGYEKYMDLLPILNPDDELIATKVGMSVKLMQSLATRLKGEKWALSNELGQNEFSRTIIAIESPIMNCMDGGRYAEKEGIELIVAKWGDQFQSPVHGHASGFIHEELISGVMQVTLYRLMEDDTVRVISTDIIKDGLLASLYDPNITKRRETLLHSFKSIGQSVSLHYVPEHTRDGRDNQFKPDYFEDNFSFEGQLKRISGQEGMYMRPGDVCLVRSSNVPEYDDHYIVITGHPVMKEHGLRVQDRAYIAPNTKALLDTYEPINGLTLLKFSDELRDKFIQFHDITL